MLTARMRHDSRALPARLQRVPSAITALVTRNYNTLVTCSSHSSKTQKFAQILHQRLHAPQKQ